ncbi:C-type lectin lectoxin-Phi1 [Procambarus clarkii]|uniref:C-type lectin lectoxin-Phi1 n=1 Tax=Procambarus clarkii TaxID=6728 RepID=UPI003743E1BA
MVATLYSRLVCFVVVCALDWSTKGAAAQTVATGTPLPTGTNTSDDANETTGDEATIVLKEVLKFLTKQTCQGSVCCPFPYHNVLDECFYLSTQETKWWSAREHCLDIKGDLAKPKHQYALKDFIFKKAGDVRVFIGGKDEYKDRNFKWLDGTPVNDSEWAPGEPNNEWKKEHCLGFISSKEPMLMDIICSQKLRFVCQYYPGP